MPIEIKVGKLKSKAYMKEEYHFKKEHPIRWWIRKQIRIFLIWRRRSRNKKLYIKKRK